MIATTTLLLALASHAQTAAPDPAPAAVPLYDDLGSHHRTISTADPRAQRYFDQGLRLVYGFNHDEAERAFREAARLDPRCAICWWGVALTLGPNINLPIDAERNAKAVEAAGRAKALVAHAARVERALIEAIGVRYSADPAADRAKLDAAYADAMRAAYGRFPADDDVATLFAESMMDLRPWKFWDPDGTPAPGTKEIVSTLETVLKRNPKHPGANHYYIHATEASPDPGRALDSAKRLATLVPGAGHLVHMPAHVYMRTGDYAAASDANAKAAAVDKRYINAQDVRGIYPLMYYTHNLHFLAVSAGMEGNAARSLDAARRTDDLVAPIAKDMPMAEFVVPITLYMQLRFGRWEDVLREPEPPAALLTATALWRFARAYALGQLGRDDEAKAERKAFDAASAAVPEDAMMNLNTSRSLLNVAAAMLDAASAERGGDLETAIAAWKKAVAAQDTHAYDEPPAWYYPVRESLGGALLRADRPKEAEEVFRTDLKQHPNNGRSLFGLAEALRAQKKEAEAARIEGRFKSAWAAADITPTVRDL